MQHTQDFVFDKQLIGLPLQFQSYGSYAQICIQAKDYWQAYTKNFERDHTKKGRGIRRKTKKVPD